MFGLIYQNDPCLPLRGGCMKHGIYDSSGDCWIGDEYGPKLFDDPEVAKIAALIVDE